MQPTLRSTLAITMLMLGVVGLALVLAADHSYSKLATEHQRLALVRLIHLKSTEMLQELETNQKELGFRMQSEDQFKEAFGAEDRRKLQFWMDQEFNRYFVTVGLLKLEKIILFDTAFEEIISSSRGIAVHDGITPCFNIVESFRGMNIADRLRPYTELCMHDGRPLYSTVLSIGTMSPKGYIQIITDPSHALVRVSDFLNMPLQISSTGGIMLHQSTDWPNIEHEDSYLYIEDHVTDKQGVPIIRLSGASNIEVFKEQLNETQIQVITITVILICISILLALFILRHGLHPLKRLEAAANRFAEGDFSRVDESGFPEVATPIMSFNSMSSKINSLIKDLQEEVSQHQETAAQLTISKEQAEEHARVAEEQRNFSNLTLQSIVDAVITTDTNGKVTYLNPMAEQLTGFRIDEAENKPIVQIMHALDEDTNQRIYDLTEGIEKRTVLDEPIKAILVQNASGVETPVEYVAAPMRDGQNKIVGIVFIIHDESVQRSLNRQLTFQATHDSLTGLINRYEFERRLKAMIHSAARYEDRHYTLCYLDLDQFKLVNDTCGHTAGDELLKQITMLLQSCVRDADTLARLGGDEFGLLLEQCDLQCAERITRMLMDTVKNYSFTWESSSYTIGVSVGIVEITKDAESCEQLMSNADSACYLAKESGRNRMQIYTVEDDKLLTQEREMHWVSRINRAMEDDRFQLYYQDIQPLHQGTDRIKHGEILLRMEDTEGGIISPSAFLPSAERYNMITSIDQWVVESVLRWLSERENKILLSINLSGHSLSNHDFLNFVVTKISEYQVDPELLCFEITETAAISHLNTAIHFMTMLKKLGCTFALDDFGSGLSSFSYLTSLPVDYLKIDGSFVVDIDKEPMHYAMVKSINEVGQVMGISTIAEFATTQKVIDCLREIGVDNAQGYAVSRPVPLGLVSDEPTPRIPQAESNVTKVDFKKSS